MQKLGFVIIFVSLIITNASAKYFNHGDCVAENVSFTCYWCSASGGGTPGRTCNTGYAGCINGSTVLKEGQFAYDSGYKCTSAGFVNGSTYDNEGDCLYEDRGDGYHGPCRWCVASGGGTPSRTCDKNYSRCTGETELVEIGKYASGTEYLCSTLGFRKCKNGHYEKDGTCIECPSLNDLRGSTTGEIGGTSIFDCYIPSEIDFHDVSGTFQLIGDCYYK